MPKLVRNILAVVAAMFIGGAVNMALIKLSPSLIPPPAGVDVTNPESLAKMIHLFEPRHFVMPWLAHAMGTLVGAFVAYMLAASHQVRFAYAMGALNLAGGIMACFMIPAPVWFMAADLLLAYLPMAWLGIQLGRRFRKN